MKKYKFTIIVIIVALVSLVCNWILLKYMFQSVENETISSKEALEIISEKDIWDIIRKNINEYGKPEKLKLKRMIFGLRYFPEGYKNDLEDILAILVAENLQLEYQINDYKRKIHRSKPRWIWRILGQ